MSNRIIGLTLSPHNATGYLHPDNGQTAVSKTTTGRLEWLVPEEVTGGANLTVEAVGYKNYSSRAILPLGSNELVRETAPGEFTTAPLALVPDVYRPKVSVLGDRFVDARGFPWTWRGCTDFRLPERVAAGVDIRSVLEDRLDVGATLVRMLSMKANNTGWEYDPRRSDHRDVARKLFDMLGNLGMYGEWGVFADTKHWMPDPSEQQDYYGRQQEIVREYPHIFLELVNEDGHPTQDLDSSRFARPAGILASHGSGLTDVQPVAPLWDYATYHARRSPPPPGAKPFNNLNPYEFHPEWPHPVPYVCEESVKPEDYGFNPEYAAQMGRAAQLGPGATFHHNAWNEARVFTPEERVCAEAFFNGMCGG